MIFRVDKPVTALTVPKNPDANVASAVQEFMGGNTMYRCSPTDYQQLAEIWTGPHPDGAPDLTVSDGQFPTMADPPPLPAEPQLASPSAPPMDPEFIEEVAQRIFGKAA